MACSTGLTLEFKHAGDAHLACETDTVQEPGPAFFFHEGPFSRNASCWLGAQSVSSRMFAVRRHSAGELAL